MSKKNIKILIENRAANFQSGETDFLELSKFKDLIKDKDYFDLIIDSKNGGFFYGQSLQVYGYSPLHAYHDMERVNSLLQKEYGNITAGLIAFAQDLFGNQFCFDTVNGNIIFFDAETGKRDVLETSFSKWADVLDDKLQYFTGMKVFEEWILNNHLEFNQRLCPKIPFVMGGEFKVANLYASTFPDSIKAYANIARQVYNLPDGTPVKLNIGKMLF
jgi:hypothetical protein